MVLYFLESGDITCSYAVPVTRLDAKESMGRLWVIFGRYLTVFGIIWTIFHFPVEFWPVYDRFQPFSTFLGLILIIGDQIG